jgi:hypothetical protein
MSWVSAKKNKVSFREKLFQVTALVINKKGK